MPSPAIFISYRRSESAGHAGRLHDRLRQWFDPGELFFDQAAIEAGDDFPERIEQAIAAAKVILVLIAPEWLSTLKERARRVGEIDFVRREVELALHRRTQPGRPEILPVLLGGATMPDKADLDPLGLGALGRINAHSLTGNDADWQAQFIRLKSWCELHSGICAYPRRSDGSAKPMRLIAQHLSPHFQDPDNKLAAVRETLQSSRSAALIARAALYGMGGLGKTQLALAYSHTWADQYDGVWWFSAETNEQLRQGAHDLCTELGMHLGPGQEDVLVQLNRRLDGMTTPWLLVYDNAEDALAMDGVTPQRGPHHVLFTSRSPVWGGLAKPVELSVWTTEQGARYLADRLGAQVRRVSQVDLNGLAEDLDGLPLALEQAAGYIEATQCSVTEYREMLAGVDTVGLLLDENRVATGYENSVARTLSVAFPALTPAAKEMLRILAFFAAEPVLERWFKEAPDSLHDALQSACRNPLTWNATIELLLKHGLAVRIQVPDVTVPNHERLPNQQENALVLHRLTLEVARHRISQLDIDSSIALHVLRSAAKHPSQDPRSWPRLAAVFPHVLLLQRHQMHSWTSRRLLSQLLDRAGTFIGQSKSDFAASIQLLTAALKMDEVDLEKDDPDLLPSMNNLATALNVKGDWAEARVLLEHALAVSRRVEGEEEPGTLTLMNNLASTCWSQGDLQRAQELEEDVLAVRQRILGEGHEDTLMSMNNLSLTLKAQGDLLGARSLMERALSVHQRLLGNEHLDTLSAMSNLASIRWSLGDFQGAQVLEERVLELRRRILGNEHLDTLNSINNLAGTLSARGAVQEAQAMLEEAHRVAIRLLGTDHPRTVLIRKNLSHLQ
jgi:tetratricopeptide (TPR) repeat protein